MKTIRTRRALVALIAGTTTVFAASTLAQSWSNEDETGLLIASVDPEGPAGKAGLKRGDIVVQAGDEQIDGVRSFIATIADLGEGDTLSVQAMRGISQRIYNITVGAVEGRPYLGILMAPDGAGARTFGDAGQRRQFSPGRGRGRGQQPGALQGTDVKPGLRVSPLGGVSLGAAA